MPRKNKSAVEIIIDSRLEGRGFNEAIKGVSGVEKGSVHAGKTLAQMRGEVKKLTTELEGISTSDDDFERVSKEIAILNTEIKRVTRTAKGLAPEVKKASRDIEKLDDASKSVANGLSVFDIALGNIAANGFALLVNGARSSAQALFEWGKEAAELGSDLAETESLLTNALGPAYNDFNNLVNDVADSTGRSAIAFKQATAPILAMTKAQGFAAEAASEMSVAFGGIALDLESYFNSATGFADVQSALAGSTETLQKYGINANVAALQQEALRIGIVDTIRPLEQAERTTALLSLVQRQAADAMGDAARTSSGFANTQRSTNEAIEAANAIVGVGITEAWKPWQDLINEIATEDLPGVAEGLSAVIKETANVSKGFIELSRQGEVNGPFSSLLDSAGNSILRNFSGDIRFVVNRLEEYAEVGREVAEQEAELERVTRLSIGTLDARAEALQKGFGGSEFAREEAESISYVIDRWGALEDVTANATAALGEYADTDLNSFFEVPAVTTLSDDLQGAVEQVNTLITRSGEFAASDFFNTTVDNQNFLEEAANTLAEQGGSLDVSLNLLTASGTPIEDVEDIATELIGDRALEILGDAFSGGLIDSEEFAAQAELINTKISELEDPIEVVKTGLGDLVSGLDSFDGGTYTSSLNIQVDGLAELERARQILNEVGGAALPDIDTALSDFAPESEAQIANRRR